MRYPYERFLRFLVSRKVDVNATLTRHGLPPVGGIWLAECRTRIRDHAPHALATYIDSEDEDLAARDGVLEWAEQEGIRPLWAMQREFDNTKPPLPYDHAYQIFVNPYARAVLGCLLLSRASEEETLAILREHFDLVADSETMAAYRTVWWDVEGVSRRAWTELVDKLPLKEERSYIAFGLNSPTAADVRDMLGLETPVEHDRIIDSIAHHAYAQFRNAMQQPHPEAAGAMRWAELALKAIGTKRLGNVKAAEAAPASPSDFHNMFSIQVTKSEHATLAQLHGKVAIREDTGKNPQKEGK